MSRQDGESTVCCLCFPKVGRSKTKADTAWTFGQGSNWEDLVFVRTMVIPPVSYIATAISMPGAMDILEPVLCRRVVVVVLMSLNGADIEVARQREHCVFPA